MPGYCLEIYPNHFLHALSSSLFVNTIHVYVTFAFDMALLKNMGSNEPTETFKSGLNICR
jgi:hypothetical protein